MTANTINVVVVRKRDAQITVNATAGIIDSTNPVTVKNNPSMLAVGGGVDRLDRLRDVDAAIEVDGATLVYNANNDMYITKKLDLNNITGEVDGGTF
jgi:hypothetical protein